MRLLVAVKSCKQAMIEGCHSTIRDTWAQGFVGLADVRFFMGHGDPPTVPQNRRDETVLNCPDDYPGLPYKTREICRWMMGKVYDFVLLVDTDTFINPKKVLDSGFSKYDYTGCFNGEPGTRFEHTTKGPENVKEEKHDAAWTWCSGGYGYILSRKAAGHIKETTPASWAEDLNTGQILGPLIFKGEIKALSLKRGDYSRHWHLNESPEEYRPDNGWMKSLWSKI